MKDFLSNALGSVGGILWYIISFFFCFAPLFFLHLPFWADFLLILAILALPYIGELIRAALYVWAFIVVIRGPIGIMEIIFFVFVALYFFTTLLPIIQAFTRK